MTRETLTLLPTATQTDEAHFARRVLNKVAWRLVPFLIVLYLFNILDRSNVGFARLTMQGDLQMSPEVFDLGYGIFYLGYLLFEVPANLLLRRVGARRWIARIMISWGLVSCATLAVVGPTSFYVVRILLGVAEAGFFPGIIFYLTYWFPARDRARMMALFMTALPIAGLLGNPLSGAIMEYMDGRGGLKSWQWLFLLEGIPSVVFGFVALFYLTDAPKDAAWLAPEEKTWLMERLQAEEQHRQQRHGSDFLIALRDPRVWLLICLYFTVAVGANAAGASFPTIIQEQFAGRNKFEVGLLAALISLCALIGLPVFGWSSDRTGLRRTHVALAAFLAALGWALSSWGIRAQLPYVVLLGFCLAQTGMMGMLPTFWALPTSFLSGTAAAGGIALINSVANIGGLFGPTILGQFGTPAMAAILFSGGVLALCVHHDSSLDR